jgi:hypothetical protein
MLKAVTLETGVGSAAVTGQAVDTNGTCDADATGEGGCEGADRDRGVGVAVAEEGACAVEGGDVERVAVAAGDGQGLNAGGDDHVGDGDRVVGRPRVGAIDVDAWRGRKGGSCCCR